MEATEWEIWGDIAPGGIGARPDNFEALSEQRIEDGTSAAERADVETFAAERAGGCEGGEFDDR